MTSCLWCILHCTRIPSPKWVMLLVFILTCRPLARHSGHEGQVMCLALSVLRGVSLHLHNAWLSVPKHILEASGIICSWSGRPFHCIVCHERAVHVSGRDHPPTQDERRKEDSRWMCEAVPEGLLWLTIQHRSLYSNLYLIRISLSLPLRLFTLAMLFYGLQREGRAWVEGSDVDMGLLLISTGGEGR